MLTKAHIFYVFADYQTCYQMWLASQQAVANQTTGAFLLFILLDKSFKHRYRVSNLKQSPLRFEQNNCHLDISHTSNVNSNASWCRPQLEENALSFDIMRSYVENTQMCFRCRAKSSKMLEHHSWVSVGEKKKSIKNDVITLHCKLHVSSALFGLFLWHC